MNIYTEQLPLFLPSLDMALVYLILFVFGSCIGSFANVCIARIPKSLSVVSPCSMCFGCKTPVKFYDNIPVVSYILLKGRCRNCDVKIGMRYFLVEIISGTAAVLIFSYHGISLDGLFCFTFFELLLILSCIDIDHRIIPDLISLPGILFFFAVSFVPNGITWQESFLGIMAGGGTLYIVALIYFKIKKTDGMGGGDIKLLAMVGAFIGWQGVLFTIFLSSLAGTLTAIGMSLSKQKLTMKTSVPFGPFISFGAVAYLLFGQQLINWYFYWWPRVAIDENMLLAIFIMGFFCLMLRILALTSNFNKRNCSLLFGACLAVWVLLFVGCNTIK